MKLIFAGTRGQIDARNRRHYRHTALVVVYRGYRLLIDCGEDWRGQWHRLKPRAILLTHAHPDHAHGLDQGADCPVYATEKSWALIREFPIYDRRVIDENHSFELGSMWIRAFAVEHSLNCPAVAYRIRAGRVTILYCPDVVYLHDRHEAMRGVRLYIGDGASVDRDLIRKQDDRLIGHTCVRTQLTWCAKQGVPEMIITHCGSQIVEGDERTLGATIDGWARERKITASIAHDGMQRVLR
jgi:phosphoribosyl 1,2-cyclic phosphodiesterase